MALWSVDHGSGLNVLFPVTWQSKIQEEVSLRIRKDFIVACTCDNSRSLEERGFTKMVWIEGTPYTSHAAVAELIGEGNFQCNSRTLPEPGEGLRDIFTTAEIAARLHSELGLETWDLEALHQQTKRNSGLLQAGDN